MNNNFDRTKTATARFSTRAIALMLFFVMLLTAIGSGSVISAIATEITSTDSTDAIPEAATEGSTIALNAIPGETVEDAAEANDAQPAPDLSEFEENEIVRGMKDDLAGSGANIELAGTGATIRDNNDTIKNVYLVPDFGGYYSNGTTFSSGDWLNLGNGDGNHYYDTYYIADTVSSSGFGWQVKANNGSNDYTSWYACGGQSLNGTTNSYYGDMYLSGAKDNLTAKDTTSGYVKVQVDWYRKYDQKSYEKFYQTDVAALSASYASPTATVGLGESISVAPSHSGGTGSRTVSYSLTKDGVAVDKASYISGSTFTSNDPGTYVVTATVTDSIISAYSTTATKTITVTGYDVSIKQKLGEASATAASPATVNIGPNTAVQLTTPASKTSDGKTYYFYDWRVSGVSGGTTVKYGNTAANANTGLANNATTSFREPYVKVSGEGVTFTAEYRQLLPKPTISVSPTTANAGDTVTVSISNYAALKDYCDFTLNGATGTFNATTGVYTLTSTDTASVTVTAAVKSTKQQYYTFSNTTSAATSSTSDAQTVTFYSSTYSLGGNITHDYIEGIYDANDVLVTDYPITTTFEPQKSKWNTWQPSYAIDDATTGTPGVYSIKFKTNEDIGDHEYIDLSIVSFGGTQYAFKQNGTDYNSNGKDFPVPDKGVEDSDNLYLQGLNPSSPGGALQLLPDTTYTITIDQTQSYGAGYPAGKITITTDKMNVTTVARVKNFDPTARTYDAIGDAQIAIGTVSADPARGPKTTGFTTNLSAVVKNSNYVFTGWDKNNAACDSIDEASATWSGVSVTANEYPTYYGLFTEKMPAVYTITPSGNNGTVALASVTNPGAEAEGGVFKAYKGATVTLTATPARGYMLSGVTADNCTATYNGNTITLTNVSDDVALVLSFTVIPTYTINIKADDADYCESVYVNSYTDSNGVEQNTPLDITTDAKSLAGYTLTVRQGTVVELTTDATSSGIYNGWTVVSGTYTRSKDTPFTADTIDIKPTSNMELKANFDEGITPSGTAVSTGTYILVSDSKTGTYGTKVPIYKDSNNAYSSYFVIGETDNPANGYLQAGKGYYFIVSGTNSGSDTYTSSHYNLGLSITKSPNNDTWYNGLEQNDQWNGNNQYYMLYVNFKDAAKTATVNWGSRSSGSNDGWLDASNNAYPISFTVTTSAGGSGATDDTPSTEGKTKLYALDGIKVDGDAAYGTNHFGETKITTSKSGMVSYPYYDVNDGSQLYHTAYDYSRVYYYDPAEDLEFHIETDINSGYQALGVRAFVMNGKTYKARQKPGTDIYYADITLAGGSNEGVLEVIPVYYNKLIPDDDYIHFYVDASSIDGSWGKNIGYSVWYADGNAHGETGGYPGQPLMSDSNGLYAYVPKYYLSNNAAAAATDGSPFAGVLITNLAEHNGGDGGHQEVLTAWGKATNNNQSFDYEDPNYISQIAGIDTIRFETKKNTYFDKSRYEMYGKTEVLNYSHTWPSSLDDHKPDGETENFELLKNIDGKPVNIFNSVGDGDLTGDPLYVVSVGNQDNKRTGFNNEWDTSWLIYKREVSGDDVTFTRLTTVHPYELHSTAGSYYTAQFNDTDGILKDYKDSKVYILYERETLGSEKKDNSGTRIDGRWLYSNKEDDTTVRLRVATKDGDDLTFLDNTQGAQWADIFSTAHDSEFEDDDTTKLLELDNRTTTVTAKINPIGYKIVGMYMQNASFNIASSDDNGYSDKLSDYNNMGVGTATMTEFVNSRDNRMVIVIEKIPAANLVITHQMYGGNNAHKIPGFYYLKAELYNSSGTKIKSYGKEGTGDYINTATGDLEITDFTDDAPRGSGYTLKVYIKTAMSGDNTFYQWFENDHNEGYNKLPSDQARGSNDPVETVRVINVDSELYKGADELTIQNLDYYSDIVSAGQVNIHHELLPGVDPTLGVTWNDVCVVASQDADATPIWDFKYSTEMTTVDETYITEDSNNYLRIQIWTIPSQYAEFKAFYKDENTMMSTEQDGDFKYVTDQRTEPIDGKRYSLAYVYVPISHFFKDVPDPEDPTKTIKVFDSTKKDIYLYSDVDTISGELDITHTLSNDAAANCADLTVAAEILDASNDVVDDTSYPETNGTTGLKIGHQHIRAGSTQKLRITLKTVLHDWTEFQEFRAYVDNVAHKLTNGTTQQGNATVSISGQTNKTITATITFGISNLFNANNEQTYTKLPFYTVAIQPEYKYSIKYNYPAYNKNFGTQSYTVEKVFTSEELNTYMSLDDTNELAFQGTSQNRVQFVSNHAPYEDNYMQIISYYGVDSDSRTYTKSTHTLSMVVNPKETSVDTVTATFDLPYSVDASYKPVVTNERVRDNSMTKTASGIAVNNWFVTAGSGNQAAVDEGGIAPVFVKAPLMIYNGAGTSCKYFKYWVMKTESNYKDGGAASVEYTKCYNPEFNLAIFMNCTVEPVYTSTSYDEMGMSGGPSSWDDYTRFDREFIKSEDMKTNTNDITIAFIENSRNQYNMGDCGNLTTTSRMGAGDRIYSDFLLSFNNVADGKIIRDEYQTGQKKAGMIIEVVGDLLTDQEGKYYTESEATYQSRYGATVTALDNKTALENYILSDKKGQFAAKSEFDATQLDNKNRIQYYYSIANRAHKSNNADDKTLADEYLANNHKIYRAYAYIADYNNGTYSNVKISEKPVYFTIYDMGSIDLGYYTSSNSGN